MKKVMAGLLLGIVISGAAYFATAPNIKKAAYDSGYEAGNKNGIATGTTAGIAQGIAEIKASQQRTHDSLETAKKHRAAVLQAAAAKKHKATPKPVQNWHVIDGKIQDPIPDETVYE